MPEDRLPPYLKAPFPCLSRRAVAVSDHPQASRLACDMIELGGNAVDGSVALSLALGCCCPYYTGIGGGGFALVWMPGWSAPRCLDFREVAPRAARPDTYVHLPDGASFEGPRSVGVPGSVAGLFELHSHWGRLPWAQVVRAAAELAERGVCVDPNWHRISLTKEKRMAEWPEAARLYLRDRVSPFPGTSMPLPELARTYRNLADLGPDYFYRGELAERIVEVLDGWITPGDLNEYRVRWREPLSSEWLGGQLYTVSSPAAGGLQLLQILGLMRRLRGAGPLVEEDYAHWLAECMRISFCDRCDSAGDPDFQAPDPAGYASEQWFEGWARRIRNGQSLDLNFASESVPRATGGTASHAVVSADGGAVLITESVNHWFGSMVVAPGSGFVLNNIMDDFATHPERPDQFNLVPSPWNLVQAGKRPVSSSAPAVWMVEGKPRLLVGSAGGPRITTSVAQILLNSCWREDNIQQAVSRPRIHHQWQPDFLEVEPQVSTEVRRALAARGHRVEERVCRSHAAAVECHWDQGFFSAGQDFRSFGGAAGL